MTTPSSPRSNPSPCPIPIEDGRSAFEICALEPLGVEIVGLDLSRSISDGAWAALRETVVREGLALFRRQPLTVERQINLGRRFGELENTSLDQEGEIDEARIRLANVTAAGDVLAEDSEAMRLVKINESWHTDSSFREVAASFSLFAAVTVPEVGGDTFFASLRKGWQALDEAKRASLLGLWACHDYDRAYTERGVDLSATFGGAAPSARHPLVRRHPETGEPLLFVSEHVFDVEGWSPEASRELVAQLVGVVTSSERVYRHAWEVGDLLVWDNRSMLHRAEGFDGGYPREMRHVRVAGEASVAATSV